MSEPIPNFGDVMTKKAFLLACKEHAFIDYDGYGHPAKPPMMEGKITLIPSQMPGKFPKGFTHIVWFNR